MTQETKIGLFIFLLMMGIAVGMTNAFAPIHEFGHYLVAIRAGQDCSFVAWNRVSCTPNLDHAMAGWWFEFVVFFLLALFVGWAGQYSSGKYFAGSFFAGYCIPTYVRGYSSYDMNGYVQQVCELRGYPELAGKVTSMAQTRWTIGCLLCLLVLTIAYGRWIYKGRA